jgi:hypothetical protein
LIKASLGRQYPVSPITADGWDVVFGPRSTLARSSIELQCRKTKCFDLLEVTPSLAQHRQSQPYELAGDGDGGSDWREVMRFGDAVPLGVPTVRLFGTVDNELTDAGHLSFDGLPAYADHHRHADGPCDLRSGPGGCGADCGGLS